VTRKTLGLLLALALAMVPVAVFATSAAAADSDVRIVYTNNGNDAAKIFVDGVLQGTAAPSTAVDLSLAAGDHTALACSLPTTSVSGVTCTGGALLAGGQDNVSVDDDSNYTVLLQVGPGTTQFQNSLEPTGLGEARFTLNNATFAGVGADVCIDGEKVIENVGSFGGQDTADLPAEQGALLAVVVPSGGACGTPSEINLAAGTNFVLTLAATNPATTATCTTACGQVLFVGQGTVPNNPDTVAFCNNILVGPASLSGFQPAFKALVGNVDPTSTETIENTQPSKGDMQNFVETYTGVIDAGDASVPPQIADAWATATAGIRTILTTFQVVGYDLSKLPPEAVQNIVLGANGIDLPGVPPDQAVVDATAAITAFVTGTCLASGGGGGGGETPVTPAAPIAAGPRFTG
jgi:hypothetical protein